MVIESCLRKRLLDRYSERNSCFGIDSNLFFSYNLILGCIQHHIVDVFDVLQGLFAVHIGVVIPIDNNTLVACINVVIVEVFCKGDGLTT